MKIANAQTFDGKPYFASDKLAEGADGLYYDGRRLLDESDSGHGGGGGSVDVDPAIDASSSNPVANRAIAEALAAKADLVDGKVPSAQLPAASSSVLGAIKADATYGIGVNANGFLVTNKATAAQIAARSNNVLPIVPSNLNDAVKAALTDAKHIELSDSQAATAREVLGALPTYTASQGGRVLVSVAGGKAVSATYITIRQSGDLSGSTESLPSDHVVKVYVDDKIANEGANQVLKLALYRVDTASYVASYCIAAYVGRLVLYTGPYDDTTMAVPLVPGHIYKVTGAGTAEDLTPVDMELSDSSSNPVANRAIAAAIAALDARVTALEQAPPSPTPTSGRASILTASLDGSRSGGGSPTGGLATPPESPVVSQLTEQGDNEVSILE